MKLILKFFFKYALICLYLKNGACICLCKREDLKMKGILSRLKMKYSPI